MNEKDKGKYAFILTFYMPLGHSDNAMWNVSMFSDQEELLYTDIKDAEKFLRDAWEKENGYCANDIVLLNCIRTIAEESE